MELKLRYKAQSLAHSRPPKNSGSDFHCKPLCNISSWTLQNLTFKWASLYPCENAKAGGEATLPVALPCLASPVSAIRWPEGFNISTFHQRHL